MRDRTEHCRIAEVVLFLTFKRSDSRSAGLKTHFVVKEPLRVIQAFKVIHFAIICRATRQYCSAAYPGNRHPSPTGSVANKRYRIAICDAILASCDPRSILCRSRLSRLQFPSIFTTDRLPQRTVSHAHNTCQIKCTRRVRCGG